MDRTFRLATGLAVVRDRRSRVCGHRGGASGQPHAAGAVRLAADDRPMPADDGHQLLQRVRDRARVRDARIVSARRHRQGHDDRDRRLVRVADDQDDLSVYDATNLLPAPPLFNIITPAGAIPPWDPTNTDMVGWAEETTLDVEMAHTIAPGASILLVETPVSETEGVTGFPQIIEAENYVIDHHLGDVISQSFSATEQSFVNASGGFEPSQILGLQSSFENAAASGVTVLAATGDSGAADVGADESTYFNFPVVSFPPDDPLVTAVGGLNLSLNPFGSRTAPDTVWNDPNSICESPCAGNGGLSVVFTRPSFQDSVQSVVGGARGLPDVSLSASVSGAVNTYTSFVAPDAGVPGPGWYAEAGASEATPLFAGEVALADQIAGHGLGVINPYLYEMGDATNAGLSDITTGNNTVTVTQGGDTFVVPGYDAGPGYDLASGLGEPNASFPAQLAALATQP